MEASRNAFTPPISIDGRHEKHILKHPPQCSYKGQRSAKYCKILIINLGLTFVQTAFLLDVFLGELIFGGDYYWKEFCVSKWVGLDNKKTA